MQNLTRGLAQNHTRGLAQNPPLKIAGLLPWLVFLPAKDPPEGLIVNRSRLGSGFKVLSARSGFRVLSVLVRV